MNANQDTELITTIKKQLRCTPKDFELENLCREIEIDAQSQFGRGSSS